MRKLAETDATAREVFAKAYARGVRFTYGTDSGVYPHALVAKQFDAYARLGMGSLDAIWSETARFLEVSSC